LIISFYVSVFNSFFQKKETDFDIGKLRMYEFAKMYSESDPLECYAIFST